MTVLMRRLPGQIQDGSYIIRNLIERVLHQICDA